MAEEQKGIPIRQSAESQASIMPVSWEAYSSTLQGLRNPKGHQICRLKDAQEFKKLEVNLEDLVKLFRYEDVQGNERFFSEAVITFLKSGYSIRDLLKVAELVDSKGASILDSSNQFWDFMEVHGKVKDAEEFVQIQDSEGLTIFRNDDKIIGNFNGFESIASVIKTKATVESVRTLVDIKNDEGVSAFRTPRDIVRFLENGGNLNYARQLLSLRDNENNQIFNEFSIALFKEHEGTTEQASELTSLRTEDGLTIFSNGKDVDEFFDNSVWVGKHVRISRSIDIARELVSFLDQHGKTIFRNGADIVIALDATGDKVEKIRPYLSIEDSQGNTYFNGEEISLLLQHEIPAEYARKLAKKGLNGHTIMFYYHLGFKEDKIDFVNSGEPKALFIYPTYDCEYQFMQSFRDEDTFKFLSKFAAYYDIKIRAVSSVEEMLKELEKGKDAYFLSIGGHGDGKSIQLGNKNSKYKKLSENDSESLTKSDIKIKEYFARMPSLQYILLDSCLAAQGGRNGENMIDFVANCAPGVLVTGAMEPTNARLTKILQLHPPKLSLRAVYTHKACTYSYRVKK